MTIAEIAKERIRKAAAKCDSNVIDNGFRVLKLDESNIDTWDPQFNKIEDIVLKSENHLKKGRSDNDLLFELLIKYGLSLTTPVETRELANCPIYTVGAGALVLFFSDSISNDDVNTIAELNHKLNPEQMRVVFKDSGFKDDVAKTNAIQILRQRGIEDVKTI